MAQQQDFSTSQKWILVKDHWLHDVFSGSVPQDLIRKSKYHTNMTYRDLPIHQRINAKGNKVSFSPTIEKKRGDLLKRVANRDVAHYLPELPLYSIQVRKNIWDLPATFNPYR